MSKLPRLSGKKLIAVLSEQVLKWHTRSLPFVSATPP